MHHQCSTLIDEQVLNSHQHRKSLVRGKKYSANSAHRFRYSSNDFYLFKIFIEKILLFWRSFDSCSSHISKLTMLWASFASCRNCRLLLLIANDQFIAGLKSYAFCLHMRLQHTHTQAPIPRCIVCHSKYTAVLLHSSYRIQVVSNWMRI